MNIFYSEISFWKITIFYRDDTREMVKIDNAAMTGWLDEQ